MFSNLTFAIGMWSLRFLRELFPCHGLALLTGLCLWMHSPISHFSRFVRRRSVWRISGDRFKTLLLAVYSSTDHVFGHAVNELVVTDMLCPLLIHKYLHNGTLEFPLK